MSNSSFKIYNASAGSGKTYTLAKSYLKILIASHNLEQFKHILAITFTNKAVEEMKTRIIDMLKTFSDENGINKPHPMFTDICRELSIKPKTLQDKSKSVLKHLIHNYASFDISTIDGFTHRVIRTFAFDLKLPMNFEVELDQDLLLNQAVDRLISKAGSDKQLTELLINFAIEKADEDKSWDISYDFNKVAKLLVNENDALHLNAIKDRTLNDFETLKTNLIQKIKTAESIIVNEAEVVLTLIEEAGLEFDDFNRKSLPNHFLNLKNKRLDLKFDSNWQLDLIESRPLYPKRVTKNIASIIDNIQAQIARCFEITKTAVFKLKFLKTIYKNVTPISVLNAIQKELNVIKKDENKLLISEFNTLISNEIKNQPTPFIYERLGEKFRHYFIDEFQDTSKMQWQNLIPLLSNSLASTAGSAMLVGDAKQAIYRWRGGEAEQFISLYNKEVNPFQIGAEVHSLDTNYRSFKAVIDFNNTFFNYVSNQVFNEPRYAKLYEASHQNQSKEFEGYVSLSFLNIERDDRKDDLYTEAVFETIKTCIENGFDLKDICVLVRKKKEGIAVADFLSKQGLPIVSSETLLLNNSPSVNFVNNILRLLNNPQDTIAKIKLLEFLASKFNVKDKHVFFQKHLSLSVSDLFDSFKLFGIDLNKTHLVQNPLYELVETIISGFGLVKDSDAHIQFYLDIVLEFSQKKTADLSNFLEFFETKKDTLSIVSPHHQNAVKIMTIHKSKGLEFPVVIFPYAENNIYSEIEPKEWFPVDAEDYNGFSHVLLNYSKDFENFNTMGKKIYNKHQSHLELDAINLLYVTFTRAVEQLYVISKKDINSKGLVNEKTYAGLLIKHLIREGLWRTNQSQYSFGIQRRQQKDLDEKEVYESSSYAFISTAKETHDLNIITNSGYLWDTEQEKAIERGNLMHLILSKIKTHQDVDFVFNDFINSGQIKDKDVPKLKALVLNIANHKALKTYFTDEHEIYNEKDIITPDGDIVRPDRLVVKNNDVIIIDYKTGSKNLAHKTQLDNYASTINSMNLRVTKKILIYINEDIKIVEV